MFIARDSPYPILFHLSSESRALAQGPAFLLSHDRAGQEDPSEFCSSWEFVTLSEEGSEGCRIPKRKVSDIKGGLCMKSVWFVFRNESNEPNGSHRQRTRFPMHPTHPIHEGMKRLALPEQWGAKYPSRSLLTFCLSSRIHRIFRIVGFNSGANPTIRKIRWIRVQIEKCRKTSAQVLNWWQNRNFLPPSSPSNPSVPEDSQAPVVLQWDTECTERVLCSWCNKKNPPAWIPWTVFHEPSYIVWDTLFLKSSGFRVEKDNGSFHVCSQPANFPLRTDYLT